MRAYQDAFMMWEPDDTVWGAQVYNDASSEPTLSQGEGLGKRHGKNGGVVMDISGAIHYIKYATWGAEANDPNKNRLWCNPGTADGR